MAELCETHKLALAPDGRCVLCRRPKLALLTRPEEESAASRVLTALLGLGLLAAMAALAYTATQPTDRDSSSAERSLGAAQPELEPELGETTEAALTSDAGMADDVEHAQVDATRDASVPDELQRRRAERKRRHTTGKPIDPRLEAARREVEVTMYSASWCFICDRARRFLEARGVQLVEYDVDRDPVAARKLEQVNKGASIPTFIVENEVIVGFHPWGLEDAIDEAAQRSLCSTSDVGAVCERPATAARTP